MISEGDPDPGEERELELVLQTAGGATVPDSAAGADGFSGLSPLVWIGFGVGGAGLVVGAITGFITLDTTSLLAEECRAQVCPTEYSADVDKAVVLSHVSTISFAVGIAGIGVGVVGLLMSSSDEGTSGDTAAVQPMIGPGFLGLRGGF